MNDDATTRKANAPALWSLAFGNVVIGTGALAFIGMLDTIARDLDASPSAVGLIAGLFSLAICISGPLLGAWTSRLDRRTVLTASLALFAVGHFAAAFAGDYGSLLAIRIATAFAGTLFTPQAAATASLLVPPERRARTMAFVFLGWSIAAVVGMPAGAWVAAAFGWRTAMTGIGVMSAVGALLVGWRLPARLVVAAIDRAAWRAIAAHPTLLRVVAVTATYAAAQFALFSYIVVAYRDTLHATPAGVTALLSFSGIAGFAGNLVAGRIADRIGPPPVVVVALSSMIVATALWIALFDTASTALAWTLAIASAAAWGAGNFATNSMQQVRLVALAPPLAAVSVALNTSAIYLGQFVGAAAGGLALAHPIAAPATRALPWIALPVFFVALALSVAVQKRIVRLGGPARAVPA